MNSKENEDLMVFRQVIEDMFFDISKEEASILIEVANERIKELKDD